MFATKIARTVALATIFCQIVVTVAIISLAMPQPAMIAHPVSDTASVSWEPGDILDES